VKLAEREADFKDFYFANAGKLRRLAILMVGDADKAEDLSHDALLKAYKAWGRIRGEDPGPYVRQALINGCRNHLRRRAVERRKAPAAPADAPDMSPSLVETMRVSAALSVLSPVRRAAVLLRFYEDMSLAEVADILGRPVNTVKSDIRRALEQLKPILEENVREKA
jgi:RNA polymerase sigma-70 factor (sigma-E family)